MIRIFCLIALSVMVSSCLTHRDVVYLQKRNLSTKASEVVNAPKPAYALQTNDVLSIKVVSAQPELTNQFNTIVTTTGFFNADPASLFLQGYSVDANGDITMPTIGKISVKNLTIEQAQQLIQTKLDEYVRNATALVNLVSFRVTVLGEVARPGQFYVFNRQTTIFDALGMAGDLNVLGNRKKVKLIRQTPEGSEVILLDLRDPDLLTSRYYYLAPNDAIYIEPSKAQIIRSNLVLAGAVSSGLTAIVLLFNFIADL